LLNYYGVIGWGKPDPRVGYIPLWQNSGSPRSKRGLLQGRTTAAGMFPIYPGFPPLPTCNVRGTIFSIFLILNMFLARRLRDAQ